VASSALTLGLNKFIERRRLIYSARSATI